jgi:hypothetical protein
MTVKIGEHTYYNVDKIEDQQTKKIAIDLMMNTGETIQIPVTENDEIIFVMEGIHE